VIHDPPWFCQKMGIAELLRAQPRWGRTRTRKFLIPFAIGENRQLGRMTIRQRVMVADALREKLQAVA
jgi:hypothetical protein